MTAARNGNTGSSGWATTVRRLRNRKLAEARLRVWDDVSLREDVESARRARARARVLAEASPDEDAVAAGLRRAEERLTAAEAKAAGSYVELTFRALPRPQMEELVAEHPPTEQQAQEGSLFNPDTFPAALVSASSVDGMTVEEATEFLASWSSAEANALWETAWQVQQETRAYRAELGKD